jgi:hypothetical protein
MTETKTEDKDTIVADDLEDTTKPKPKTTKKKAAPKLPTLRDKLEQITEMHPEILNGRLYGPFTDYTIVTTDFGDYGLARHLVLGFANEQILNKETFQMDNVARARYYRLKDGERVRGNGVHPSVGGEGEEDFGSQHGHGETTPPPNWGGTS